MKTIKKNASNKELRASVDTLFEEVKLKESTIRSQETRIKDLEFMLKNSSQMHLNAVSKNSGLFSDIQVLRATIAEIMISWADQRRKPKDKDLTAGDKGK